MNRFYSKSGAAIGAASLLLLNYSARADEMPVYKLQDYVVSAGPLARSLDDYATPFTSLDSDAIRRENGSTLGALLDGQPGVSATSYGGGASRPVIRGFDGPRVSILDSGLSSLDISETSPDHAVTIEPLLTDRIEILRGPSTLLYGSSAIGGVVNVISKDIPRQRVDPKGYEGAFETRSDTVSEGETYLGYGTVGGDNWAFRVSGLTRDAEDYKIPGDSELHEEEDHDQEEGEDHEEDSDGTLNSSFVETEYTSFGGTWFFTEQNYIGASFSIYDSFYGVPGHSHGHEEEGHEDDQEEDEHEHEEHADDGVAIDLERKRFDIELALFDVTDWIEALRVRAGYTDYEHTEGELASHEEHEEGEDHDEEHEEGHEPTLFAREGFELRAEVAHREWGFVDQGIFGVDFSIVDFEAIGEEGAAFGPPTETSKQAFFISEHVHRGDWHYEFGGRAEAQQIDAVGKSGYNDLALSVAGAVIYNIDEKNSLSLSLQRSQRHPNAVELYADGDHVATRQYERGDESLELETAYGVDLGYRHTAETWSAGVSVFYTDFDEFIFSQRGPAPDDVVSEFPFYAYTAVDASFWGIEAEVERLLYNENGLLIHVGLLGDCVQAENRDNNEDLPRIPPLRIGGTIRADYGNWEAGFLVRHAFDQNDTAPLETDTDSYTEMNFDLGYTFDLSNGLDLTVFARGENLLDEDIRHHTSFIKDLAPLPGRNFTFGARVTF